jgi:DNA invertase Pin-like site-specific DNA recombinase
MSRTAIYARKSTESDDRQVQSLDAQLHWALTRCAELGLRDPLIIKEAKSAKTPGRPEFERLMALVQSGEVDTIVTWKADRLSRNARDAGTVLWALESRHLKQIVTSDREYTADADIAFVLGIELGLSAKYSKDLSKNIRRGIAEKLRRGEWSWKAPLGYKNVRENTGRSTIAVDEEMAAYVRRMFALVASGNYSVGRLTKLARDDWKLRIPGRSKTETKPVGRSGVHHILTNSFYVGAMSVKGEVHQGSHEPLVSKEQFDLVQAALSGRRVTSERPQRQLFKLSGLMTCGSCGRLMSGFKKTKPSGRQYVYYVCSKHLQGECPQPLVAEAKLYPELSRILSRITLSPAEYAAALEIARQVEAADTSALDQLIDQATVTTSDAESRTSRLLDLLLAEKISQPEFDRKRRELEAARVEQTLSASTARLAHKEKFELLGGFLKSLVDAAEKFKRTTDTERRYFLHSLGFELVAKGAKVLVRCGKPAAILMNRGERPLTCTLVDSIGTALRAIQSSEPSPILFSIHLGPPPSATWKRNDRLRSINGSSTAS